MEDIEQIKRAAEVLLAVADEPHIIQTPRLGRALEGLRLALHPKRELIDGLMNLYPGGFFGQEIYPTREEATIDGSNAVPVHLREVTPAPEWERWFANGRMAVAKRGKKSWTMVDAYAAQSICDFHNAEMEKATGTKGK